MDYGTEALKKLLQEVKEMTLEEYNELFELAQQEYKNFFEQIKKVKPDYLELSIK